MLWWLGWTDPPFHSAGGCSGGGAGVGTPLSTVQTVAQWSHPQHRVLTLQHTRVNLSILLTARVECRAQCVGIKLRGAVSLSLWRRGVREAGVYAGASASQQKRRRCSATGGHLRWCAPLLAGLLPEQLRSVLSLGRPAKLPLSASSPSGPGLVLLGCAALLPLLVSRILGAKVVRVVLQGSAGRGSCRGSRGRGRLGRSGKASCGVARLRFKQG